jgi:glycosyltransferase involved in cell wall biosynthesis
MPGVVADAGAYTGIRHFGIDGPLRHFWYGGGLVNAVAALLGRASCSLSVARAIGVVRPDVLVASEPDVWLAGALLKPRLKFRLVEDLREVYEERSRAFPRWLQPTIRAAITRVLRLLVRSTDEIIHVSPERARIYRYLRRDGIMAFPFPDLHAPPDYNHLMNGVPIFLHAGALRRNYAGRELLAAAMTLAERRKDWSLVVLGGIADDMQGDPAVAHLVAVGLLKVYPTLPVSEVQTWLARSHVGVNLVLPIDLLHVFAQPRKLYEYLGAGLPVLGADVPTIRRVLSESGGGVTVDARDPVAIAGAMGSLLDTRESWPAMGRGGRAAVEDRYNWGVVELQFRLAVLGEPSDLLPA